MNESSGILRMGLRMVMRNKRYLIWFYLLNLLLAVMGALALQRAISGVLDNSLYSGRLLHGFDVFAFLELAIRPELASHAVARPHLYFTYVFLFLSILFMPGVLDAYSSERRVSREDFWATCGRNVWRFLRLFALNLLIGGVVFAVLAGANGALGKAAGNSTNEKLPFYVQLAGAIVIVFVMTWIRTWFDLAQADVVLRDESRVRKSLRRALHQRSSSLARLLGADLLITLLACGWLLAGLWVWDVVIPPARWVAAFLVGQAILIVWLTARFWQRACAVAYCVSRMAEPAGEAEMPSPPVLPVPLAVSAQNPDV